MLIVNAAAPTVFAWIVDRWGWRAANASLLVSCSAAWLAMEAMSRWYDRQRLAAAGIGGPAAADQVPSAPGRQ